MTYAYDAGTTTPTYAGLIEFNGIRLNDGTFHTQALGGLQDGAPIRQSVTALPSDSGGYAGAAFMDPRLITIDGWFKVSSPDDVPAAQDALRAAFAVGDGSLQTLIVQQRGWTTRRQLQARVAGPVVFNEPSIEQKKLPWRDFTVTLVAPDPLMYDADNLRTVDVVMTGTGTPTAVTNSGTAPTPFVARFVDQFSNAGTLTHIPSGKVIVYNAVPAAGTYRDFNTNPVTGLTVVTNSGANDYANAGTWTLFAIPPGTSNFKATASLGWSASSKVTLTWRDAWY